MPPLGKSTHALTLFSGDNSPHLKYTNVIINKACLKDVSKLRVSRDLKPSYFMQLEADKRLYTNMPTTSKSQFSVIFVIKVVYSFEIQTFPPCDKTNDEPVVVQPTSWFCDTTCKYQVFANIFYGISC